MCELVVQALHFSVPCRFAWQVVMFVTVMRLVPISRFAKTLVRQVSTGLFPPRAGLAQRGFELFHSLSRSTSSKCLMGAVEGGRLEVIRVQSKGVVPQRDSTIGGYCASRDSQFRKFGRVRKLLAEIWHHPYSMCSISKASLCRSCKPTFDGSPRMDTGFWWSLRLPPARPALPCTVLKMSLARHVTFDHVF